MEVCDFCTAFFFVGVGLLINCLFLLAGFCRYCFAYLYCCLVGLQRCGIQERWRRSARIWVGYTVAFVIAYGIYLLYCFIIVSDDRISVSWLLC